MHQDYYLAFENYALETLVRDDDSQVEHIIENYEIICYAFMHAVDMANVHVSDCPCYQKALESQSEQFMKPS